MLVVGRLVVGFGVGVASVAAPLYAAEKAPTRSAVGSSRLYQLAITIGIFIAYFVDQLLTERRRWRLMLGVSAIPGVLLLVRHGADAGLAPLAHEGAGVARTPRPRRQGATPTSTSTPARRHRGAVDDDADQATLERGVRRALRKPLMIGVGLAVFQQITGINAIIYYADTIFAAAGSTRRRPGRGHHVGDRRGERARHASSPSPTSTASAASRCCSPGSSAWP